AKNSAGYASKTFPINIAVKETKPVINMKSLTEGITGKAYSEQLEASGSNIKWTKTGGTATWAAVSAAGAITGKPTKAGTFTLQLKAANSVGNASATLKITVKDTAPAINTTSLSGGTVGQSYTAQLSFAGSNLKWSKSGTATWAKVSTAGKITGTPTKAGTFTLTVTAKNSGGSVSKEFNITVKDAAPVIKTTSLQNTTTGKAYTAQLSATGKNIKWSISGTAVAWATISTAGKITGTPKTPANYTLTVKAENTGGSVSKKFDIKVTDVKPVLKTSSLKNATTGQAYTAQLSATGANITWCKTGGTADWLSVSASGTITGTPSKGGTFTLSVKAENTGGSASKTLKITVKDVKPAIKTTALKNAAVYKAYTEQLSATGTNVKWSKTGGNATWATVSESGKIIGTPSKIGKFTLKVKAANSAGNVSKQFNIIVTEEVNASVKSNQSVKDREADKIDSNDEIDKTDKTDDAAPQLEPEASNDIAESNASLSIVNSDDINISDIIYAASSTDLIFKISEWTDNNGNAVQVQPENLKIYINGELDENIKVNDDNIFEIMITDNMEVYAEAETEEDTLMSDVVYAAVADGANGDSSKSSGQGHGCNSGFGAIALILALAAVSKFKFKR
ncbi:MAG: hypothetical protein IJ576_07375, partial [Synergistaceae bacterium]|nr:hypothetical protein [Synergistaceae bacterium]MBR1418766.1 hypothetical protein [Synergistaceae bacterium]